MQKVKLIKKKSSGKRYIISNKKRYEIVSDEPDDYLIKIIDKLVKHIFKHEQKKTSTKSLSKYKSKSKKTVGLNLVDKSKSSKNVKETDKNIRVIDNTNNRISGRSDNTIYRPTMTYTPITSLNNPRIQTDKEIEDKVKKIIDTNDTVKGKKLLEAPPIKPIKILTDEDFTEGLDKVLVKLSEGYTVPEILSPKLRGLIDELNENIKKYSDKNISIRDAPQIIENLEKHVSLIEEELKQLKELGANVQFSNLPKIIREIYEIEEDSEESINYEYLLKNMKTLIADKQRAIDFYVKKLEKLETTSNKLDIEEVEDTEDKYNKTEQEFEELQQAYDRVNSLYRDNRDQTLLLEDQLNELKFNLEEAKNKVNISEEEVKRLNELNKIQEMSINDKIKEIEELQRKQQTETKSSNVDDEETLNKLDTLEEELREQQSKVEELETLLKDKENLINRLDLDKKAYEEIKSNFTNEELALDNSQDITSSEILNSIASMRVKIDLLEKVKYITSKTDNSIGELIKSLKQDDVVFEWNKMTQLSFPTNKVLSYRKEVFDEALNIFKSIVNEDEFDNSIVIERTENTIKALEKEIKDNPKNDLVKHKNKNLIEGHERFIKDKKKIQDTLPTTIKKLENQSYDLIDLSYLDDLYKSTPKLFIVDKNTTSLSDSYLTKFKWYLVHFNKVSQVKTKVQELLDTYESGEPLELLLDFIDKTSVDSEPFRNQLVVQYVKQQFSKINTEQKGSGKHIFTVKRYYKKGRKSTKNNLNTVKINNALKTLKEIKSNLKVINKGKGKGKSETNDDGGLYSTEITDMMKNIDKFKGVYASDELHLIKNTDNDICFIMNTSPRAIKTGHWVAINLDPIKKVIEYYDSFGDEPTIKTLNNIYKLIKVNRGKEESFQLKINRIRHQSVNSDNCGYFAMKFLYDRRVKGLDFKKATGFDKFEKMLNRSKQGEKEIETFKNNVKQFKYVKLIVN